MVAAAVGKLTTSAVSAISLFPHVNGILEFFLLYCVAAMCIL